MTPNPDIGQQVDPEQHTAAWGGGYAAEQGFLCQFTPHVFSKPAEPSIYGEDSHEKDCTDAIL